jgi:hypothetical protein
MASIMMIANRMIFSLHSALLGCTQCRAAQRSYRQNQSHDCHLFPASSDTTLGAEIVPFGDEGTYAVPLASIDRPQGLEPPSLTRLARSRPGPDWQKGATDHNNDPATARTAMPSAPCADPPDRKQIGSLDPVTQKIGETDRVIVAVRTITATEQNNLPSMRRRQPTGTWPREHILAKSLSA